MKNTLHRVWNNAFGRKISGEAARPATFLAASVNARELPEPAMSLMNELRKHISQDQLEQLLSQILKAFRENATEADRYNAAEALSTAVYPKFKFSEYGRLFLEDEGFLTYYRQIMDPGNWHSLDRKYTLDQLLKLVAHLDGDAAECGTYKGATAYRICLALGKSGKIAHLFDSFEGLSTPGEQDGDYWFPGALQTTELALRATLTEFSNYRTYKGWIPARFAEVEDRKFNFVHIDVDLYQPTLDSLRFFYSRTVSGGIILMDDYGFITCPGAKLATDEFFSDKPELVIMLTTGQAMVIKR